MKINWVELAAGFGLVLMTALLLSLACVPRDLLRLGTLTAHDAPEAHSLTWWTPAFTWVGGAVIGAIIALMAATPTAEERDNMKASEQFLLRLADTNGAIVGSSACHVIEMADARVRGDWFQVDSLGFVLRTKDWRERAEYALHEATSTAKVEK